MCVTPDTNTNLEYIIKKYDTYFFCENKLFIIHIITIKILKMKG